MEIQLKSFARVNVAVVNMCCQPHALLLLLKALLTGCWRPNSVQEWLRQKTPTQLPQSASDRYARLIGA